MKTKLEKRFIFLLTGESVAIALFIYLSMLVNNTYPNLQLYALYSFWTSFFILLFLLLQGTIYWYVKLKQLKKDESPNTPRYVVLKFKKLEKINIALFILSLSTFVIDLIKWYPTLPLGGLSIAGFIYLFALLEYINYYYIQLSYDNRSDLKHLLKSKKLKRSSMNKDFARIMERQTEQG